MLLRWTCAPLVLCLALGIPELPASAAPPMVLGADTDSIRVGRHLDVLQDPDGELTIEDVVEPPFSARFARAEQEVPNFSFRSPPVWVRFDLENPNNGNAPWLLILRSAQIDHVDLYYRSPGGEITHERAGDFVPFDEWDNPYRYPSFQLNLPPGESLECYLRLESTSMIRVALFLRSVETHTSHVTREAWIFGAAAAALLVIVLYNLFFGVVLRDRSYIYYLLSVLSSMYFFATWQGLTYQFIWGSWPSVNHVVTVTAMGLVPLTTLAFMRHFLETKLYTPRLDKVALGIMAFSLVIVPVSLVHYRLAIAIYMLQAPAWIALSVVVPVKILAKGYRPALHYLAAYSVFFASVLYALLELTNVVPVRGYSVMGAQLGLPITLVVMAAALAIRFNKLHKRYSSSLQHEVAERTKDLSDTLASLEESRRELHKSEQLYRSILDTALDGFGMTDLTGKVLEVNDRILEMSGYSREELIGRNAADLDVADGAREVLERIRALLISGSDRFETVQRRKDGSLLNTEVSVRLLPRNRRFVAFLRDITDRKKADEKLADAVSTAEQLRDVAESANRTKSAFVANMSHEIRTPMNAIMGMTDLALGADPSPKVTDYLTKIRTASRSLLRIINNVLDFSKIEAERLELESIPFDLRSVVRNMSDVVAVSEASRDIEFLIYIDPEIPGRLLGDPTRLEQVLTNLATNAVNFTSSGEVLVKVELADVDEGEVLLRFSVEDTGIGIPEDRIAALFQPFTQADGSTTRQYGGTGLGLTICKRLVHRMGGQIDVESEPGEGSLFYFQLVFPVHQDSGSDLAPSPDDLEGTRVLVVDDNSTSRQILRATLESFSFHVSAVESGQQALEALIAAQPERPYNLVLLDWKMPGMDGIETARRIDREDRLSGHIPKIIMITAFGSDEVKRQADVAGLDGYLTKPVQPSLLLDTITAVFGSNDPGQAGRVRSGVKSARRTRMLQGARILVAEDNEINQQVAQELLVAAGAEVRVVSNGREAVEAVREVDFDVVLMDIQMPEMDGFEATDAIRAIDGFEDLPIIAMTAHAMAGDREKILQRGLNDHIAKPIDLTSLPTTLARWIEPAASPSRGFRLEGRPLERATDPDLPGDLPGIDTRSVLRRLGGKVSLVKKLLATFAENQANTMAALRDALERGDMEQVEHIAHALKGVSGNLSAKRLFKVAGQLEIAARQQDIEICAARLIEFEEALREVRESIDTLGSVPADDTATATIRPDAGAPTPDLESLAPALRTLADLLETSSVGAVKHLDTIDVDLATTPAWEAWSQTCQHTRSFRFADALRALKKTTQLLGIEL